jgi:hypothetical protein
LYTAVVALPTPKAVTRGKERSSRYKKAIAIALGIACAIPCSMGAKDLQGSWYMSQ